MPLNSKISATTSTLRRRGPIGGSASTAGAQYGASIATWAACKVLLGSRSALPWSLDEGTSVKTVSSECEEEVDDLRLELLPVGTVYIQIKHGLRMGTEFDKGIAQLVGQFATTKLTAQDRLVLVTDSTSSNSVRTDVPQALRWFRDLPESTPLSDFPYGLGPRAALNRIQRVFEEKYIESAGTHPSENEWRKFLSVVHVTELNTLDEGADQLSCFDALNRISFDTSVRLVWECLVGVALDSARLRRPVNLPAIQSAFVKRGIQLNLDEANAYATVEFCARQITINRIAELRRRNQYVREHYVDRRVISERMDKATADATKSIVVVGGSGTGKTTWCVQRCDTSVNPPRLLVASEYIQESDAHLRDTLKRLIEDARSDLGTQSYTQAELHDWLRSTRIQVFVDGLDRAIISTRKLASWLKRTASDLHDYDWQLVATTRPEIVEFVRLALGDSVELIDVEGYSEIEAMEAAEKLGTSALSRYRHPRMMSFCARIQATHGAQAFRHEQAIEKFLAESTVWAAGEAEILADTIEAALYDLSIALADSATGVLSKAMSRAFQDRHPAAYEALRKENILLIQQGLLRVDIDEIAEHLAGRHIDIPVQVSRWREIRGIPLKAGALRAALEQLAAASPADAAVHIEHLATENVLQDDAVLVSLLCSVIAALEDPAPMKDVAVALVSTWKKPNFLAAWGTGLDLLNFADGARWQPMDRIELLWIQARLEHGLDWRSKHWLKPHIYSDFQVTVWRLRFLSAIHQAGCSAWAFLMKHIRSDASLVSSKEANLGDLAQGMFVIAAEFDIPKAMAFAGRLDSPRESEGILSLLATRYPTEIRDILLGAGTTPPPSRLVHMIDHMKGDDWGPHAAAIELAQHWLTCPEFSAHRRVLLRIAANAGNSDAAWELLSNSNLDSTEVTAIFSLDLDRFTRKVKELLSSKEGLEQVLDGLSQGKMTLDQVDPLAIQLCNLRPDETLATPVAYICENMAYVSLVTKEYSNEFLKFARHVLEFPFPRARSALIYPSSTRHQSESGHTLRPLQVKLLELIAEMETDLENLNTLCFKLGQNYSNSKQAHDYCLELSRSNPDLDWKDGFELR